MFLYKRATNNDFNSQQSVEHLITKLILRLSHLQFMNNHNGRKKLLDFLLLLVNTRLIAINMGENVNIVQCC